MDTGRGCGNRYNEGPVNTDSSMSARHQGSSIDLDCGEVDRSKYGSEFNL